MRLDQRGIADRAWRAMPHTFGRHLSNGTYTAPPHIRFLSWLLLLNGTGKVRRLGVSQPPGTGKALAPDTPIATPAGWTNIGDLSPGDRVFDERGEPCTVTAVSGVWNERPRYEVVTSDGDMIVADEQHEWPLSLCRKQPIRIYPTHVLARARNKRAMSVVALPLNLPPADLPVDPYVLGVWLGDGAAGHCTISCHDSDAEFMRAEIERRGYATSDRASRMTFGILGVWTTMREMGLCRNKHIPTPYLRASADQRLDLLRGLIDTDGSVAEDGWVEFCNTNLDLANGVLELARSLGCKASCQESRAVLNGVDCGPRWRVGFYLAGSALLPRKADRTRNATRTPNRYLQAVPTAAGPTVCISVDSPSRLFLAGRSMTPTHNSELIDYYDPAWLLEHDPRRRIILASYSGSLAEEQGKRVRNLIESSSDLLSVRLAGDSKAADRWKTTAGGGMWAVGIGGSVTGRRASHLVIDDPVKNMQEAMSEVTQLRDWNWYTSTARTRSLPRASISLVQTRWSMNDLSGRIRVADTDRHDWLFVDLPAIALENETCESVIGPVWTARLKAMNIDLFPWHREQGEPLWPELEPGVPWFDLTELNEIRYEVGEIVWSALYQQQPSPTEGNLFKRDKWQYVNAMPPGPFTIVRRWDMAASEGKGDWTASCLMALHHENRMPYILDMTRDRLGPQAVEELITATCIADREKYGKAVHTRIEREPGSAGKNVESYWMRQILPGFNVKFFPSSGDKTVRAFPLSGQQQASLVHLVRREVAGDFITPPWWEPMIEEAAVFPNGTNDDLVDVASAAYVDLIELKPRRARATVATAASRQLTGGRD